MQLGKNSNLNAEIRCPDFHEHLLEVPAFNADSTKMTILYIECGSTLRSPFYTGIQRVVRNIIDQKNVIESSFPAVNCVLVEYRNKNFYFIPPHEKLPALEGTIFRNVLIKKFRKLGAHLPEKIYKTLVNFTHRISDRLKERGPTIEVAQKHNPSEKSVLLLLDATWNNDMWSEVARFRAAGGSVCAVLYDLIPFTHPETVEKKTKDQHTSWWINAVKSIDSVICISKAVRNDFYEWKEKNITNTSPIIVADYFYLGAEIGYEDPLIKIIGLKFPFFLMVGSIEPRKNHSLVVDVFDSLWASGSDVSLVICANNSWNSEEFISRIRSHKEFNQRLFMIEKASDRDLVYLNRSCCAVIMASFAEGFGLPIVEAMALGAKVICNDIPVFREIGSDGVSYFSFNDRDSLAQKIHTHISEWISPVDIKKTSPYWITWSDSAIMLTSKVLKLSGRA